MIKMCYFVLKHSGDKMGKYKTETERDIQLLKSIARTGFTTDTLIEELGLTSYQLKKAIDNEFIIYKGNHFVYGDLKKIYILSPKAKYRMKSEFLINPYKSDLSQLEHDYCLAKVYCSLNRKEQSSWITETELRIKFNYDKTTDAMYISSAGERVGVEIITDSYSKDEIDKKMDFIRNYCDSYTMFHTYKDIKYKV